MFHYVVVAFACSSSCCDAEYNVFITLVHRCTCYERFVVVLGGLLHSPIHKIHVDSAIPHLKLVKTKTKCKNEIYTTISFMIYHSKKSKHLFLNTLLKYYVSSTNNLE
jgi:hypothetical protein